MKYSNDFYQLRDTHTQESARQIVAYLMAQLQPRRVVDVGCGVGTWLHQFKVHGCPTVLGLDSEATPREYLHISDQEFRAHDLTRPIETTEKFDLALSLEVGEHLPSASAETLVNSLVNLSDVVLFSAAIPGQGGQHHVNERWQEYWRQLFAHRGYACFLSVRNYFWNNTAIHYWYRQNMLLYVAQGASGRQAVLARQERINDEVGVISVVHPEAFEKKCREMAALAVPPSSRHALALLVRALLRFVTIQNKVQK